jgi:hypothetical protein
MSQTIINTAKTVRQMVIRQVESIPEEFFDVQPKQFGNTIRWNLGHIISSLDGMLSLGFTFNSNLQNHTQACLNLEVNHPTGQLLLHQKLNLYNIYLSNLMLYLKYLRAF